MMTEAIVGKIAARPGGKLGYRTIDCNNQNKP
jgi:hypothetical protein